MGDRRFLVRPDDGQFAVGDYAWWVRPPYDLSPVCVRITYPTLMSSQWDWVVQIVAGRRPRSAYVYARDLRPITPLEVIAACAL